MMYTHTVFLQITDNRKFLFGAKLHTYKLTKKEEHKPVWKSSPDPAAFACSPRVPALLYAGNQIPYK